MATNVSWKTYQLWMIGMFWIQVCIENQNVKLKQRGCFTALFLARFYLLLNPSRFRFGIEQSLHDIFGSIVYWLSYPIQVLIGQLLAIHLIKYHSYHALLIKMATIVAIYKLIHILLEVLETYLVEYPTLR